MASRNSKKGRNVVLHREAQAEHARRRIFERYPWVQPDDYHRIRCNVRNLIRDGKGLLMWSKPRRTHTSGMGAYAVRYEGRMYFVGYDHGTGAITTWFPRTDPRVQEWVLENYGTEAVKALFECDGKRDEIA